MTIGGMKNRGTSASNICRKNARPMSTNLVAFFPHGEEVPSSNWKHTARTSRHLHAKEHWEPPVVVRADRRECTLLAPLLQWFGNSLAGPLVVRLWCNTINGHFSLLVHMLVTTAFNYQDEHSQAHKRFTRASGLTC